MSSPSEGRPLTPETRRRLAAEVTRTTGLAFPSSKKRLLDAGIWSAVHRLGEPGPEGLLARLTRDDPVAVEALVTELVVGETYFFRELGHVKWLRERALPELLRRARPDPIRLWSAGCATGEEAYSMAIAALEGLGESAQDSVEVLGTDLSAAFLERAREGRYGEWSLRNLPGSQRARWFFQDGGLWRVRPSLKRVVRFAPLNLCATPEVVDRTWPHGQDVIFCRNVLLYFEARAAQRTLEQLGTCLQPGGWLMTGPTDPFFLNLPGLERLDEPGLSVYRRTLPSVRLSRRAETARRAPARTPPRGVSSPPAPPKAREASETVDLVEQARALGNRGETDGALELLERRLHEDALDPAPYLLRASLRLSLGQPAEAADDVRAALLLDRELTMAHVLLASARAQLGQVEMAQLALKHAQALLRATRDPEAVVAHSGGATVDQLRATCGWFERALDGARAGRTPRGGSGA